MRLWMRQSWKVKVGTGQRWKELPRDAAEMRNKIKIFLSFNKEIIIFRLKTFFVLLTSYLHQSPKCHGSADGLQECWKREPWNTPHSASVFGEDSPPPYVAESRKDPSTFLLFVLETLPYLFALVEP